MLVGLLTTHGRKSEVPHVRVHAGFMMWILAQVCQVQYICVT
jgi:hypothetical protein